MASNELEVQSAQDLKVKPGEIEVTKSSVYVDPFAPNQNNKFQKGDTVHMSIIEHGTRRKGIFTIRKARYSADGGFWEYQLSDGKRLYDDGAFIREKALKLEKRRE